MENSLEVNKLCCGYGEQIILRDISFALPQGGFITIIGPNGAGKTTLFKALTGMLPVRRGMIAIEGKDMTMLTHKERARRLAVVSQTVEVSQMTVEEYVLLGRLPYRTAWQLFENKQDDEIAEACMSLTNIIGKRDQYIHQLSGGEQQLAAIARALAQQTDILLLDEPTAHLDIAHQINILNLIQRLNKERRLSVLLIIHDLNLASEFGNHLLMLKNGTVYTEGRPEEVLTAEHIRQVYEADVTIQRNPLSHKPNVFPLPRSYQP